LIRLQAPGSRLQIGFQAPRSRLQIGFQAPGSRLQIGLRRELRRDALAAHTRPAPVRSICEKKRSTGS